jgi:hypothetical protein
MVSAVPPIFEKPMPPDKYGLAETEAVNNINPPNTMTEEIPNKFLWLAFITFVLI